ncbi:MAG TPA: hypothetical protein VE251_00905 [Xanthobacteraceae bacterium]|nr:hypothetical protein [Xanthobacteraceae bacterium]
MAGAAEGTGGDAIGTFINANAASDAAGASAFLSSGDYGQLGVGLPTEIGANTAGANTLLQTAKTYAPLISAAGSVGALITTLAAPRVPVRGAPSLPPVTPMPGTADVQAAMRASIAEQLMRRGRASTILTGQGDVSQPLGGN